MSDSVQILITGDTYLGGGRVKELALENNAEKLYGDFLSKIRESDLAITNLESPMIDDGKPILKTGPNLKSPLGTLPVLKSAGFDLATLANNHIMDYGPEGLFSTMRACEKYGITCTGAGKNLEEAMQPWIREINGFRIAILNIAENEFGTTQDGSPGAHPLHPVQNYYSIRNAKEYADRLIVIVHGGHEHYALPSPRMKQTYRFFADAGADAVVGHHTHCYSGYEVYNGSPIFYSLGNFLFDKSNGSSITPWNEGILLVLSVGKDKIGFQIDPFVQNSEQAGLRALTDRERSAFENSMDQMNAVIENDRVLEEKFDEYCDRSQRLYSSYIEPHSVRVLHALRNRNLLPSLLTKRKKKLWLNLTRCEAHRDILLKTLTL